MFRRKHRHDTGFLNTTSTADISFMLLIFFLVTTSIDSEKGLLRHLSPLKDTETQDKSTCLQRNMLPICIGIDDHITCDGNEVTAQELKLRVEEFVENSENSPFLPQKNERNIPLLGLCEVTDEHIIAVEVDRNARYDTYFHAQEAIMSAYVSLRDKLSRKRFNHPYSQCSQAEYDALTQYYPQRISETERENTD